MLQTDSGEYGRMFAEVYDRMGPPIADISVAANQIVHALDNIPKPKIVELGVGTGRVAIPLAAELNRALKKPIEFIGVDSSSEMLSKLHAQDANSSVTTGIADITSLQDLQDCVGHKNVDLVICVGGTFPQLLSAELQLAAFVNAAQLLAPRGRLLIECHNPPAVRNLVHITGGALTVKYPAEKTALSWFMSIDDATELWDVEEIWVEDTSASWLRETTLLTPLHRLDSYAKNLGMRRVDTTGTFGTSETFSDDSMMYTAVYEKLELPDPSHNVASDKI